ncbi:hypothetical protein O181_113392 [Austropuccinia psidii MF-1]|uniref:Uncharacterized protein n=1 Tax=Austropuccinia psidii MF-1 TaxID=1389203 RepID=A0A9Q3K5J3_9BASI|nr:hypothetical protein [Austropuccinia psidii MF-1]
MSNQQHINPLLFVSDFLTDTDSSSPNYETGVPSSKEYNGEDDEYLIANDSGLGINDDTPPKRCKLAAKRQHIQSNVYNYFEKLNPSGEWVEAKGNFRFIYKCRHCIVKLVIIGCNTLNLNKH